MSIQIKNYTQMGLKELEEEATKEGQKLLDAINNDMQLDYIEMCLAKWEMVCAQYRYRLRQIQSIK